MTILSRGACALLFVALPFGTVSSQQPPPTPDRSVSDAEYARWKKELSNWGRWGRRSDRRVEPDHSRQAAAGGGLVREGVSVSLAADAEQ